LIPSDDGKSVIEYGGNFFSVENKWEVDLRSVDFITMKENWDDGTMHVKLHIGTKEVRMVFSDQKEMNELIEQWKNVRNKNEYNEQTR
jgi:hypothetical protein